MSAIARLAKPADDESLRRLLREESVREAPALYFEREPHFFDTPSSQTLSVLADGELRGMVSRSLRQAFVNGRETTVGALRNLRVRPGAAALELLAAGAAGLKRLHRDHRVPYYLAALAGMDARSSRLLQSGRLGLPVPQFRDKLVTLSFATSRGPLQGSRPPSWAAIQGFLKTSSQGFQFAPCFRKQPTDGREWLAVSGPAGIEGVASILDEREFKQIRVARLPRSWKFLRAPYNAIMPRLRRWPTLPAEGQRLESASLCCFCAKDIGAAATLLDTALAQAERRGISALNLTLSEGHPLLEGLRRMGGLAIESRLALLHWKDGAAAIRRLDSRPAYIDASDL